MVIITPECTENAANMLRRIATFIGEIGDIRYYVLDGKAWSINGGTVARAETGEEAESIINQVRVLNAGRTL